MKDLNDEWESRPIEVRLPPEEWRELEAYQIADLQLGMWVSTAFVDAVVTLSEDTQQQFRGAPPPPEASWVSVTVEGCVPKTVWHEASCLAGYYGLSFVDLFNGGIRRALLAAHVPPAPVADRSGDLPRVVCLADVEGDRN